jgi:hypothetical protein
MTPSNYSVVTEKYSFNGLRKYSLYKDDNKLRGMSKVRDGNRVFGSIVFSPFNGLVSYRDWYQYYNPADHETGLVSHLFFSMAGSIYCV